MSKVFKVRGDKIIVDQLVVQSIDDAQSIAAFKKADGTTVSEIGIDGGLDLKITPGTIAAAGSDNTDATAIATKLCYVTASNGTKGVILPDGSVGDIYIVHNTVNGQNLKLYPPADGTINGGTATTGSVTVAGEETAIVAKVAANTWFGGVLVDF